MFRKNPPRPVHVPFTTRGEELVWHRGRESGRGKRGANGYRSARDSTSLNARDREPIDPRMPSIPPA